MMQDEISILLSRAYSPFVFLRTFPGLLFATPRAMELRAFSPKNIFDMGQSLRVLCAGSHPTADKLVDKVADKQAWIFLSASLVVCYF